MSYTAEQLLSLSNSFQEVTSESLVKEAKKKEEVKGKKKFFPFWLKNKKTDSSKDSNSAKDKKVDPKAEVRNRGDACVPAEKAKDKKDHFPINNENQARNALAQVNKFTNAPEWYSGSLQSLVSLVAKKVKTKYPSIEVSKDAKKPGKKKASAYYGDLLSKFGQDSEDDDSPEAAAYNAQRQKTFQDMQVSKQQAAQSGSREPAGVNPDYVYPKRKLETFERHDPANEINSGGRQIDLDQPAPGTVAALENTFFRKLSQFQWNPQQSNVAGDAASTTPGATYSPSGEDLDADFNKNLQKFLLSLNVGGKQDYYVGRRGADGIFGDATKKSLQKWQALKGLPTSGETDLATLKALTPAMQAAGFMPKTETVVKFDHKTTNDTLNSVSSGLTQLTGLAQTGKMPPNAKTLLDQYEKTLNETASNIMAVLQNKEATPEESQLAGSLNAKVNGLRNTVSVWRKMYPATTVAALENEFFKKLGA